MSNTGHLPELESLRSQVTDLTRELAARDQSMQVQHQSLDHVMQDLRAQSDLLKAIMEGTAADTGDEFFASLATRLTASLHMQYAVIGEIVDGTPMTIRTVAVASEGTLLDNFEYDLTQAPCGTGLTKSFWCYEQGVQALFPNFPPLATLGVDSHSGVSIRNKQGNAVGVIVVMDTKPITNPERLQALLYVFAPRVAAELQRRHTETELQEQTQRLAHAQTLAHLGSWDWEIGSGRMGWSDEQFRIFGHEPGLVAATHETFLAALLPDDHDRVLVAMNATLVNQAPFDLECRIVRPSGEVRVIHVRGDVHRDATGHPLSMAGTVLDITERKQVEETLRASEERWHLAVRGSNDGIWDWNVQTGEIFFSTRWKAMRGFGDYEIKNHVDEWRSRIHPDDLDRVLQSIDAYLAQQAPELCEEYRVQRKDGSYMWILDRGVALWADDGTPLRMAGSETDITERKRAEESLSQNRALLQSFVEHTPAAVAMLDRDLRYVAVSKRWYQDYQLGDRDIIGLHHYDVFPEIRKIEHWQVIHRRCLAGEIVRNDEDRFVREDGKEDWLRWEVRPWTDEAGSIGGIIIFTEVITERKRVEVELKLSEARLNEAQRVAHIGSWALDIIANRLLCSDEVFRIFEIDPTRFGASYEAFLSIVHPEDRQFVDRSYTESLTSRTPYSIEHRLLLPDGRVKHVHERCETFYDTAGKPIHSLGTVQDITDRRQAEETLRQSEERYHTLAETLPVGIFRTDREGSYLYVNKRWCEIAGLSHEKALNHGWVDATHPEDRQDVIEEWHRAIIRQEMFSSEYRFQRGHGATTWVLCQAVTEKDSHGETIGYIGTITDITKRKWAEQTLRRSEWDLRTVLDALPVGVWFTDATGKVRLTNPAGLRIWADVQQVGLESTEGHPGWWENVSSSGEPHRWALARALTKGKATLNEELSIQCLDGTSKVIINSAVALFGENGQVSGAIIVNQDITERKTLERDQAQTQAFLQSILENIPHTITVKDAKTLKIVQMNRAAEQVLKLDRHVLTDKTLYDCLPEGEANALWAADMDALQRRTLVEVPEHVVKREGEPDRIFRTKKAPIFDAAGEPQYILSISEDITERTTAETSRRQRAEHIIRFQQARLRLTKVDHVDRAAAWRTITETAGSALGVERVSIWLFNEDRSAIVCRDLYELSTQSHEQGALLDARHYPKYFEALASDVALATSDARTDPRTDEFRERYLPLFGITSMMDAPIHLHGNVVGVLCHEHTGPPREWTSEEQSFAASVADQVALSLEAEERALAETALRSTKNHLQAILDHSPAVIFVKDTEGHYLLINRRYEELHQVSSNEVIGKTDYDIFDRDTADGLRSNDRKVLQTGCPLSLEETVPVENGILTVISTKFPLKDANGRPYAVCGITTDITERKRVEEALAHLNATLEQQVAERTQALRESEERHRTLFKSSRDAMMTLAPPTWNFTSGNPATVSMFHTKDETEFISLSPWNLSPERQPDGQLSVDKAKKMIDAAMREGSHFFEWTHKHITGEEFPATVLLTRTVLGGQPQLQATVRDITEQKKVEAAVAHLNTTLEQQVAERTHTLRQREEDLKRAIEEREQISQDLHDGILQSLFAIGLTLETSKSMMSPRKRKISGPPLDQAIDQLNRVMHEIRNFIAGLGSDLLQGKDLPTALQHMLDSLTQNHATRVRLTIEDRAAQAVSAEQSLHLLLVIQEAVSNCIRHGHAQEATVSLKMLKQGVRLNIRDNGRGFNPDVAKGTGHGLSNMAARAQKIGGRFTVLSKVNEGTRIVLDLPKEASSVRR